jgi:hypothetical protein
MKRWTTRNSYWHHASEGSSTADFVMTFVIFRQDIAESSSRLVTGEESRERSQGSVEITAKIPTKQDSNQAAITPQLYKKS